MVHFLHSSNPIYYDFAAVIAEIKEIILQFNTHIINKLSDLNTYQTKVDHEFIT